MLTQVIVLDAVWALDIHGVKRAMVVELEHPVLGPHLERKELGEVLVRIDGFDNTLPSF